MRTAEIRERFLRYFEQQGHVRRPSSSIVPTDDPTVLFTMAGMLQFKKIFLGAERPTFGRRVTTSQKCVRAGGKHNDLEQVGHTARHQTFFEMLGNFSFGDYFKRDAIHFAWEFVTRELGMDPRHLRVTVYKSDDEARALWKEIAGFPDSRIYGLGEKDNFWQMADTGPCGPCSEIYIDLAGVAADWKFPDGATGEWTDTEREDFSLDAFYEGTESGRFLEFWNLVFMQYDRSADGTLTPLPKPSVDTGAGLERMATIMQGVTNSFYIDTFAPLIGAAESVLGLPYEGRLAKRTRPDLDPAAFHVLADHARTVAFLLADGVYPSSDGRGYVLRRILRRAVRHAWLLGKREPVLHRVVATVIDTMSDVYPELTRRRQHILDTTTAEEVRFLATIEGGMQRFEQIAPAHTSQGSTEIRGTIPGEDAFKLYDTFGFPIDLTELMARERGYTVDIPGFERALDAQRTQSREERKSRQTGGVAGADLGDMAQWESGALPSAMTDGGTSEKGPVFDAQQHEGSAGGSSMTANETTSKQTFVGYEMMEIETQVTAVRHLPDGRLAVILQESPFYAESGGQIADTGEIVGDGWRVAVDEVRKIEGRIAAIGAVEGTMTFGSVTARVPGERRRDIERNHTATHLLHAALRAILGEHVHQAGSLVAPDRLRFDFTHHGPLRPEQLSAIEERVNSGIWSNIDVRFEERSYQDAVALGAMALFGEKYGDVVRVVSIPGVSMELCGGTHTRNTGHIALFKVVSESGVAAGVRRIEAVTGPKAYEYVRDSERTLQRVAELVKSPAAQAVQRLESLLEERRTLQRRLDEALRGGGDQVQVLLTQAQAMNGSRVVAASVATEDVKQLQALGDALREQLVSGVGAIASSFVEGKSTLLVVVTDDLRARGVRADEIIKVIAAEAGGRGGGKAHMAQAGLPDPSRIAAALARAPELIRPFLEAAT